MEGEYLVEQLLQSVFAKDAKGPRNDWIRHPVGSDEDDAKSDEALLLENTPNSAWSPETVKP